MSKLKPVMLFFLSECHAKNCRFQLCAFLKSRKISEITSAVDILFNRTDARRFALQNTCSKQFCGKLRGRCASVLERTPLQMFPKVAGKFPKNFEQLTKIQRYSIKFLMPMPTLPNGRSFTLMKSCYSKRHMKIHGPRPSRFPIHFYIKQILLE